MLESTIKKMAACAVGATVGAGLGAFLVPFYWAADTVSPLSYPLAGAAGVSSFFLANKERIPKPALTIGMLAGAAMVPFTPVNALTRPVLIPLAWATFGAVVAVAVTKE